ncbi:FAD-dependent oxidoreductase [Ectothiorhodospiraceae bacterium 2226]|nr:FAD-dependent oxidoreductase [Ectothiorhodospiraceae bacterium 2226]
MSPPRVAVVGGGWAGLAAAVELAYAGAEVTVLEAAKQVGGRARRVPFAELCVDNGQHLMIGAYRETLRLMRLVGVKEASTFARAPLELRVREPEGPGLHLAAPRLPAPLHLVAALARARGLSLGERWHALRLCLQLARSGFQLPRDESVAELLARHRQPHRLRELLWEPLCLATLNTHAEHASAQVFLRVLHEGLARRRSDSDLLYHRTDLGEAFPVHARDFIERYGGSVRLGQRVSGVVARGDALRGVRVGNETLDADHVVLAVPPYALQHLAPEAGPLQKLARELANWPHEPICTVYLRYPEEVTLGRPMLGLSGGIGQWAFDRALYGQEGLIAVVVSGNGPHLALDNARLAAEVGAQLARLHPAWPAPGEHLVIREKRATFRCSVDIDRRRPGPQGPLAGCWLAGDYTATRYPATLEGAVASGVQCARAILTTARAEGPAREAHT